MRKSLFIALPVLAVLAIGGVFLVRQTSLAVVKPTRGQAVQSVYATGSVEATVMLPIAPRLSARLIALNVDEGSEVAKGQVLAQLEDTDLQHTLKELAAREEYARKNRDRAAQLVKNNAMSRDAYDKAMTDYDAAVEARKAAAAQAGYAQLVAPADGRIIRRDGEIGQMIPSGQTVFWMTCCAPLRISADVDEEDIALVQPGQQALIRADAFPGRVFKGTVTAITPKGDSVARSYRVRIGFDENTPLLIGMTTEANIILHEKADALLVPTRTVVGDSVWVVENGKLAKRTIQPGARGTDQTEATEGITEDSLVVLNPEKEFKDGQSVRARLGKAEDQPHDKAS